MDTTNDQILRELKEIREENNTLKEHTARTGTLFSVIDKIVLSVLSTALLGLFAFCWNINTEHALLQQKVETLEEKVANNVALEAVEKLENKLEQLSTDVTNLRILLLEEKINEQ